MVTLERTGMPPITLFDLFRRRGWPMEKSACLTPTSFVNVNRMQRQQINARKTILMEQVKKLMESVYGKLNAPSFPQPLPEDEAGICSNGQRRYLWTDAFALINLVATSELDAADRLIESVHQSLGRPRSTVDPADAMQPDESTATGFAGLRIGKLKTKKVTDFGMTYDGMYAHYIVPWLLALVRAKHLEDAVCMARSSFKLFFVEGEGIQWKLSVDGSAPPGMQASSSDTHNFFFAFRLIDHYKAGELDYELEKLGSLLHGYRPRVTLDPLGWGLDLFYGQWSKDIDWQRMLMAAPVALSREHFSLPFRLYGALIGAQLSPFKAQLRETVQSLIQQALNLEFDFIDNDKYEEHSCINRVMLASALLAGHSQTPFHFIENEPKV